jgi:hypothetical protein
MFMNNNSFISFILVTNPKTFASILSHMAQSTTQHCPVVALGCTLDSFFLCRLNVCHTNHNHFSIA